MPYASNENCLEGMCCPRCLNVNRFLIKSDSTGWVTVEDDGTQEDVLGDATWEDTNRCMCSACDHAGKVADFKGKTPVMFDEFQQFVRSVYTAPYVECPADLPECGDGLLRFLMTELSVAEDCDSYATMVSRLDTVLQQVQALRDAAEAKIS